MLITILNVEVNILKDDLEIDQQYGYKSLTKHNFCYRTNFTSI